MTRRQPVGHAVIVARPGDISRGAAADAVGEFIKESGTEFTVSASLGEYVAQLADSIENGTDIVRWFAGGFLRYRPYVGADGCLAWHIIREE